MRLLTSALFSKSFFSYSIHSFRNTFKVSNNLDPDLDPNCLQRLSEDDKRRQGKSVEKEKLSYLSMH